MCGHKTYIAPGTCSNASCRLNTGTDAEDFDDDGEKTKKNKKAKKKADKGVKDLEKGRDERQGWRWELLALDDYGLSDLGNAAQMLLKAPMHRDARQLPPCTGISAAGRQLQVLLCMRACV